MINLKNYSGIRVGGSAEDILEMHDSGEVQKALKIIREEGFRPYVIGDGTNTFWGDGEHKGLILLKYVGKGVSVYPRGEDLVVEAEAGVNWNDLVFKVSEYGWGIESLAAIPGTVGAAPVQNIGAYGREFKDVCAYVSGYDIATGEKKLWSAGECRFGYRTSIFNTIDAGKYLITRVQIVLSPERKGELPKEALGALSPLEVAMRIREVRSAKLPDHLVEFNCGSYFKNPIVDQEVAGNVLREFSDAPHWPTGDEVKFSAAWLIEKCDLKGARLSEHVRVSSKHALVLVTDGKATCAELLESEKSLKDKVFSRFGIMLSREPNCVE